MNKELQVVLVTGLVFLVMTAVAGYYVSEKADQVKKLKADIETINNEIKAADDIIARQKGLEKEKESLEKNLSHYITILPSPEVATRENLMRLVQEKCERSQFTLERFTIAGTPGSKPAAAPTPGVPGGPAKKGGGFEEIGVKLEAVGTYEQFLRFLNSLERHESFVRVNTFRCTLRAKEGSFGGGSSASPPEEEGKVALLLKITLDLSTFRYQSGSK
ncbi:MAG: hypothetical protein AB7N76_12100 [Planctomycetota bacterium]